MKLYYSPGACSLSPHIVAQEAGIDLELVKVNLRSKMTDGEGEFCDINPTGMVPLLVLDNGEKLTEGPAIVQYLADLKPEAKLAPANGSFGRVRLQEALNYIATEIHKSYSPLFRPQTLPEARVEGAAHLGKRYAVLDQQLADRQYLLGDQFSVADAYLFTANRWADMVKLDLSGFAHLQAFQKRVAARPAVQAALKAEGL